jgi:uncharacterized protein (TIGR02145 family)
MNKANIVESSEFFMAEGDILHYILIVDNGVTPTIDVVSKGDNDNTEEPPDAVVALPASDITSSSFTANWNFIENAQSYYLDVSTNIAFSSFVGVYNNLPVGAVNEYPVTGLDDAITYYYRVRGANDIDHGDNSNIITTTTSVVALTDADGNVYSYVTIGTQQWTVENLKTTKYRDGSAIRNIVSAAEFNLVNGGVWTNYSYDTFSSPNVETLSAVADGSVSASAYISPSALEEDRLLKIKFTLTLNAGTLPRLILLDDDGLEMYNELLVSGLNEIILNTTGFVVDSADFTITNADENNLNPYATDFSIIDFECIYLGWAEDITGAYCWYNNVIANKTPYGALYNWHAVNHGNVVAGADLAPAGWRVPSDADVATLVAYLSGDAVAGGKLKEIGLTHWLTPNTDATNETGFTAVGSGERTAFGPYTEEGAYCHLWTTDEDSPTTATEYFIETLSAGCYPSEMSKINGFSVRCMRDV